MTLFLRLLVGAVLAVLLPAGHGAEETQPTEGQTTIVIKRRSGLFGQGGIRYVIDRGRGVLYDSMLVEKLSFPDNVGNFCIPQNVDYFSTAQSNALSSGSSGSRDSGMVIGRGFREDLKPNAALIGKFDSHGILIWKRPPGRMRLELVNVNGNQSVSAPIEVEAGKSYEITILYGDRTEFVVAMRSESTSARPR